MAWSDPAAGWPLSEAVRRMSRREVWRDYQEALRQASACADPDAAREMLEDPLDLLERGFRSTMAAGGAAGFALRPSAAALPIPAPAWKAMSFDMEGSTAVFRAPGASRAVLEHVRVTPWLHLAESVAAIAGLPLAEAFRRFVLDDGEVIAAIERAEVCFAGEHACLCGEVLDGRFTARERLWPADLADYDLVVEWADALPAQFAHRPPGQRRGAFDWLADEGDQARAALLTMKTAERIVRDRFTRFMTGLCSGAWPANGYLVNGSASAIVSPAIWLRPTTRVDFINGEIYVDDGSTPRLEWTGLMLASPDRPPERSAAEPSAEAATKPKGGVQAKHAWEEAFERLAIKLGDDGHPDSGAALARMMMACFEDMRADAPAEDDVKRWLRDKRPKLWLHCAKGGQN